MKQNMLRAMENLRIETGIRSVVEKLWKHGYRTIHSCEGHLPRTEPVCFTDGRTGEERTIETTAILPRYIAYQRGTGDGWFEKNAKNLGFKIKKERDTYYPIKECMVRAIFYYAKNQY